MNYIDFKAGNNEYKLRLTTKATVTLEKQLGCNPIYVFGNGDVIPTVTQMVAILHASLQALEHGITMDKAYDIFDAYLCDHAMTDFIQVIVDIYRQAGLISKAEAAEGNEKN